MVALDQDLLAGELLEPFQLDRHIRSLHSPGEIAGNKHQVLHIDPFFPGSLDLAVMPHPVLPELVHPLAGGEAEMEVTDSPDFHWRIPQGR
ncbi:MAG: hypothetical protein VX496_07050 [Planctomycetota bacterium]|nr:hypothetical protein [Planctomycetota bacterium]